MYKDPLYPLKQFIIIYVFFTVPDDGVAELVNNSIGKTEGMRFGRRNILCILSGVSLLDTKKIGGHSFGSPTIRYLEKLLDEQFFRDERGIPYKTNCLLSRAVTMPAIWM